MKGWSIHIKIFLGFLCLSLVSTLFLFLSYPVLEKIQNINDSIVPQTQLIRTLKQQIVALDELEDGVDLFLILPSSENKEYIQKNVSSVFSVVQEIHQKKDIGPQAEKLQKTLKGLEQRLEHLIEQVGFKERSALRINEYILKTHQDVVESVRMLNQMLDDHVDEIQEKVFFQNQQIERIKRTFLSIQIFILFLCFILAVFFSNVIVSKIVRLNEATQRVANGNFDVSCDIVSDDEIGALARSFNMMRQRLKSSVDQLRKHGRVLEDEVELRTKELVDKQRALRNMVCDLNLRREQLEEANRIINMSSSVMFKWQDEEKWPVMFVTDNVEQLTGYEAREFLSQQLCYGDMVCEDDLSRLTREYSAASEDPDCLSFFPEPYRLKTKQGELKWVEERTTFERDDFGKVANLQGIITDVSKRVETQKELKEVQGQLLQSEKMAAVGQLSAGVAHEVKNPLAIISLAMDSLTKRFSDSDEKSQRYFLMIRRATERANKVVMDLMNFSRYSEFEKVAVAIEKVIEPTIDLVGNIARIKGVEIRLDFKCPKDMMIFGDIQLLEQVFLNLFNNALDAIDHDSGLITVQVSLKEPRKRGQKKCIIKVSDNGSGISKESIKNIFNPFFTTKEQGKGTGLGLSTVFMIIESHQGKINVESKEGKGTTFIIELPIASGENV